MTSLLANIIRTPSWDYIEAKDGLASYLFNGEPAMPTWTRTWFKIPKQAAVTKLQPERQENHRFELQDATLADRLPLTIPFVVESYGVTSTPNVAYGDYHWYLTGAYTAYESLYRYAYDKVQPDPEPVELLAAQEIELPDFDAPVTFEYATSKKCFYDEWRPTVIKRENTSSQLIDRLFFPDLVLHERPSSITSGQMYAIVRQWVKDHIDPKEAEITSDYDFCFAVEKRVPLNQPVTYREEILNAGGRSFRNPRYKHETRTHRKYKVFEMTHSPENYKGYTPIAGMTGNNLAELQAKIDFYLDDLMTIINEPICECPTCNGCGVLPVKVAKANPGEKP
jgi:hypothetical protein